MKRNRRNALLAMLCAMVFYAHGQQAQLITALIDGCAVGNDGADEWVLIYSGGTPFTANASNLQIFYGTTSPAATNLTQSFRSVDATTNSFVAGLNTRITDQGTCNFSFINTDPGTTSIPAGSHVLIFNDDVLTSGSTIDYDAWCNAFQSGSDVYVLLSTDSSWPISGTFANAPSGNRFLRSTINSNTVDFSYSDNWSTTAGNYVTWNDGGGAGAIFSNYTGCRPTDINALPVSLIAYTATAMEDHIFVHWTTINETGNSHFTLEKSMDAMTWETIGIIPGHDTTHDMKHYGHKDFSTYMGRSYYRLSQTDFNGSSETFEVISTVFDPGDMRLKLYPNPASDYIEIKCPEVVECISLIDIKGRTYRFDKINLSTVKSRFDIRTLPRGVYRVLIHGSTTTFREKLIKVN